MCIEIPQEIPDAILEYVPGILGKGRLYELMNHIVPVSHLDRQAVGIHEPEPEGKVVVREKILPFFAFIRLSGRYLSPDKGEIHERLQVF